MRRSWRSYYSIWTLDSAELHGYRFRDELRSRILLSSASVLVLLLNSRARKLPSWAATWAVGAYPATAQSPTAQMSRVPCTTRYSLTARPRRESFWAGILAMRSFTRGRTAFPVAHTSRP